MVHGKTGNKKPATYFATLLQNALNSNVARFITHIRPVLQQIRLLTGLNMGSTTRNIAIQLVLQHCCKTSCTFFVATAVWENSWHLATLPLVYPPNDVWETCAEIPYWWRVTTQIWVVTSDQYGISAFVSQTSFDGETSGSVAKCRLFSQAIFVAYFSVPLMPGIICSRLRDTVEPTCTTSSCKRPPMQKTKIFPVKALQLEPLVNDHLL